MVKKMSLKPKNQNQTNKQTRKKQQQQQNNKTGKRNCFKHKNRKKKFDFYK